MQDDELPRAFGGFTLLALQGSGASGNVYLARARGAPSSPLVVIKAMHPSIVGEEVLLRRFEHEALISVAIDSPHVARVLEVGTVGEQPYIAMERVEGWTLSALMTATREEQRTLPAALVAAWACDALRGLHALHVAVHPHTREPLSAVHRDISPKNLMVGRDLRLRVIDFGLGTSSAQDWATRVGAALGTPGYTAPEQRGGARIDPRADVYSLGVVAWELLALRRYVEEGRPPAWRSVGRADVPRGLEAALARAVDPAPSARFASAEEMAQALEPFATGVRDRAVIPARLWGALDTVEQASREWASDTLTDPDAVEPTRVIARREDPTEAPGGRAPATSLSVEATQPGVIERPRARGGAPRPAAFEEPRAGARTLVLAEAPSGDARAGAPGVSLAVRGLAVVAAVAAGVGIAVSVVPRDPLAELGAPLVATATAPGALAAIEGAPRPPPPSPVAIGALAIEASPSPAIEVSPSPAIEASPSPAAPRAAPRDRRASPSSAAASSAVSASPSGPAASASPGPSVATPAPAPATPEDALRALVEQAQRVRRAHPEHGAAIDEILTDATLWSRSRDAARAQAMIAEQSRRLAALAGGR